MSNTVHSTSMSNISPPPPYQYYYHQQHHHSSSSDVSRPSLGFPLGTALLLVVIFSLSGIFSCCYHWEKFRSLRRSYDAAAAATSDLESGDVTADKAKASLMVNKEEGIRSVPVIMPGDQMPRFIAMPCPCAPLRLEMSSSSSLGKKEDDETPSESDHMPSKPTSSYVPTAPM